MTASRFLLLVLLTSCSPASEGPVYIPEPITDPDVYSALCRAVRSHNRTPDPASVLSAVSDVRAGSPAPAAIPHLDWIESHVSRSFIDPRPAARAAALGHRSRRSTFYVLYGWLHDWEVERERSFVLALTAVLNHRGYEVVLDEDTTPGEWYAYISNRDMAGILWRSEGWFERKPTHPLDRITTRVWTTSLNSETRHRIFSDDWASTLPEGLSFAAIASCGTAGPYLEDEVDALEDLPPAGTLTFHTFDTALLDRTVFLRTYRGLLATSGYAFDDLSWTLATTLPPERADLDPVLAASGRRSMIDLLSDPEHPSGLERTMESDPLTWIPLLIDSLPDPGVDAALNRLSGAFTGVPESFSTAARWTEWWNSLATLRDDALYVRDNAPSEADLWISLVTTFTSVTDHYRGEPQLGIDLEGFCWERFLRCARADLSPWQRSADLLTRSTTTFCSAPLPAPLTITYDPSTRALAHDLEDLLSLVTSADVLDSCASLD